MQDRNFDDMAEKFTRNIYGTTKGKIRQVILWQDLQQLLTQLPPRSLQILDAGGGEGRIACELAKLGHQVTLCDISSNMLNRAQDYAAQQGMSQQMRFIQSSAQEIAHHIESPVDLILFHAVLEWVAQPQETLNALVAILNPSGALSLMFYNYQGLLMLNVLMGNMKHIQQGMPKRKRRSLAPDHPLDPQQVYGWLEQMQMQIRGKTGVRVFHDYLRDKTQQVTRFDDLLSLEQRYCRQEPFISLGRYIHVMAYKAETKDPTK